MGHTAFDVDRVDPGPGSIIVGGEVQQCPVVQQGWERDARIVEGHPLRLTAGGTDPPDVALFERQAVDEVDEGAVVRPDGKVVVDAGLRHIDLASDLLVRFGNEQRIAFRRRVVNQAPPVGRPVELGSTLQVGSQLATHRRNRQPRIDHTTLHGVRHTAPQGDQRPVWRKAESARPGIPQFRHTAFRQVVDLSRPDLGGPRVPRSIPIGEKHDELPVAGNGRVVLRSFEIRQPRDLRAFQRVPPEVLRAPQLPRRRAGDDQQADTGRSEPFSRDGTGRRLHTIAGMSCSRRSARGHRGAKRLLDFETRVAHVP